MTLHTEEQLVPLTALMHLWVSLPLLVLHGARSLDVGGVHNGALPRQ